MKLKTDNDSVNFLSLNLSVSKLHFKINFVLKHHNNPYQVSKHLDITIFPPKTLKGFRFLLIILYFFIKFKGFRLNYIHIFCNQSYQYTHCWPARWVPYCNQLVGSGGRGAGQTARCGHRLGCACCPCEPP